MSVLRWFRSLVGFLVWYGGDLLRSNGRMLRTIAIGGSRGHQVVTECRTGCRTSLEITVLALLWSLTPGTLVLATRREPGADVWSMSVHDIYADGPEHAKEDLLVLESKVLPVLRPVVWLAARSRRGKEE